MIGVTAIHIRNILSLTVTRWKLNMGRRLLGNSAHKLRKSVTTLSCNPDSHLNTESADFSFTQAPNEFGKVAE